MRGLAQTVACVVLLTAAVVHGRSIDNPAEDSSALSPVIQKALAKVEREAKDIPSPVQGGEKDGELVKVSRDDEVGQLPAFYYRRYYDAERDGGEVEDREEHDDNVGESSEQVVSYSYFASPEDGSGSSKSFGTRGSSSNSKSVIYGTGVASKPPGTSSKKDFGGFPISTSVSKSVSSSVSFSPSTKQTETIDKGTFVNLKPSSIFQNTASLTDSKWSESSAPAQAIVQSNRIHSSPTVPAAITHGRTAPQAPVYNHHQSPAPAHAPSSSHVPSFSAAASSQAPSFSHAPTSSHFSHAPASSHSGPIQVNNGEFTIHQKTFQAHPGAPTFNIPIPIPTSQLPNAQPNFHPQPIHQNQIAQHFEAQQQLHQPQPSAQQYAAASESFHKVTHQNPAAQNPYYETQHSVFPEPSAYDKMMQPFKNIGSSVSKAWETMGNSVRRGYSSLQIPARMTNIVNTVRKSSMNDYVQRTVSGENAPLIAGAVVLGSLGLIATGIAVSNSNLTLGKRSIDDPAEEFILQMVDSFVEPTFYDQLEEYTSWTDSECSKRVFCDVMSLVSDDYIYTIEKRMGLFLNMLDHGREEEMSIKKSAADVMDAVRRRECIRFTCGDQINSVVIPKDSSGPR